MSNSIVYPVILSMFPVFEVRGGIPFAMGLGYNVLDAFVWCTLANVLIIPLAFLFLDYLHKYFMKIKIYAKLFNKHVERVRAKAKADIRKWSYMGLLLFVAIPFPGTGAYTGVLISWLFKMKRLESMLVIGAGVVLAGVVVALASFGIFSLF
jgi:uncharacterized membrane protein